jgi:hypothetical protein
MKTSVRFIACAALAAVAVLVVPPSSPAAEWDCDEVSFCFGDACAYCEPQIFFGYTCEFAAQSLSCCCRFVYIPNPMRELCFGEGECQYVG